MDLLYSLLKRTPFSWVETPEGIKLHISEDLYVYHQVLKEYRFSDLGADDLVIDIGANIGVFSILAAKQGARVLSIEPVMGDELRRNILLNRCRNIRILECALGNGEETEITWEGRTRCVPSLTLSEMIEELGRCTFLKVDCEGGEWCIDPEELRDIRRIEMELHRMGAHEKYLAFMDGVRKHFYIEYDPSPHATIYGIIHGYARKGQESQSGN
ncbi:MAG: FkbM family methyltransferase [Methanomicrobiales archaeon]|nr:FkbM family methyltransferase [Methanomicrobiales archaeon]